MSAATGRLHEPLTRLLGARTANALAKMGLVTVDDLLRHYPRRYADPGQLTDMGKLQLGEHVSVHARVLQATVRPFANRGGARLEAVVTDGRHQLVLTFFAKHRGALRYHEEKLQPQASGVFSGVVGEFQGKRQLTHPDYLMVGGELDDDEAVLYQASLPIPIYPATASMATWKLQHCVRTVLDTLSEDDVPDPVPFEVLARAGLATRFEALLLVHKPTSPLDHARGRRRLRFEEAFVLQSALAQRRARAQAQDATARSPRPGGLRERFEAIAPFTLTEGQVSVGEDLAYDLAQPRPMQRLLQGEVGSGKTVVALRAMLQVIDAGGQAALLAPTEVLAAQHARTLAALLGPLAEGGLLGGDDDGTRVALLTGSLPAAARKRALLQAASGEAGIVVGTHALLGEHVQFADLGLVVVDEQHRFGVEQRDALRAKGRVAPHLLVMTATPIPRTVAMTVFGDLEVSSLTQVPAGRSGVQTVVVPADNPRWMERTWQRVREEVDGGHRAYVVCPRIHPDDPAGPGAAPAASPSEVDDADLVAESAPAGPGERPPLRAVLEVVEALRATPALAGLEIDVLHGQLAPADKDAAMTRFARGESQVLVSTTVVEVGVDVPEATVMVVFDADRFGLSQLHQLRGRVGRGTAPGLCLLVSTASPGTPAAARVEALAETTDGFRLAQLDLELRAEGDVLGAAQSGRTSGLRLLRVVKDADLIEEARRESAGVVAADPELSGHPALVAAIAATLDPDQEDFLERA
ncbi:ATP-dependent DNA helicase RecG [Xylanimonas ulmi]|uniref:Probable DNA 3'-5' helicase RecG n=1 Tax=Xylanimonas ulmi TaxID=228973 RepID=A0A4Q7M3P1_9MICO|nr:ATP-dependent DNA helicase RecG [Xylanibacterium ulmi]RZS61593.1 ATP-dependent DNA helicase RecG [Xylanibacterium ulmi]